MSSVPVTVARFPGMVSSLFTVPVIRVKEPFNTVSASILPLLSFQRKMSALRNPSPANSTVRSRRINSRSVSLVLYLFLATSDIPARCLI